MIATEHHASLREILAWVTLAAGLTGCGGASHDPKSSEAAAQPSPQAIAPQSPAGSQPAPTPAIPTSAAASTQSEEAYDKGATRAAEGKFQEARAVFEAAARRDPLDGSLASGAAMLRDVDEGRVNGETVQRIFRAMEHANGQRWEEAHFDVDEALKLSPRYPYAYATRATLLVFQGQYPNAVEALNEALKLDPAYAQGYYSRGAVQAELKQFDAAIADYTRAIKLQPSLWEAYRNRGSAYTHKNDPQAAIAEFTKAHELRPGDVDTILLRGAVESATNQWDAAIADFTKVIELDARNAAAHYNRGLAYDQKGDVGRAMADYTKAIELEPTDPSPLINRGRIYMGRREYDRAIADYDKAFVVAPGLMLARFNKAVALDRAGRPQEAVAEYRTFLQNAGPDDEANAAQARQRLATLERQRQE